MPSPALEVRDLTKVYGDYCAVDHISFDVPRGSVVGLLGPNGAGKSTTIQMLLGITEKTSGQITYFGEEFARNKQKSLQRINFTSAYDSLQGRITVRENLMSFGYLYGINKPAGRVAELSETFDLGELMDQRFWNLSAGQRTRVNLAKAMINNPDIVLMDEPTASLDPDVRDRTMATIEHLRDQRSLSILYTSHNMDEVTRLCDDVIFLDHGRIVKQDTPENLAGGLQNTELVVRFAELTAIAREDLTAAGVEFRLEAETTIAVPVDVDEVPRTLSLITSIAGLRVVDLDIRKPNLEDVFLELTRRQGDGIPAGERSKDVLDAN